MANSNPVLLDLCTNTIKEFGDCLEFTIGRAPTCTLDLATKYISRSQCVIKKNASNDWALYDQSSFHTTLLNNKNIESGGQPLKDADKITFVNYKNVELVFYSCHANVRNQFKRKASDIIEDSFCAVSPSKSLKISQFLIRTPVKSGTNLNTYNDLGKTSSQSLFEAENKLLQKVRDDERSIELLKMEVQELKESLKESEMEQERLIQEYSEKLLRLNKEFEQDKMSILEQDIDMDQDLEMDLEPDYEPVTEEPDLDLELDSSSGPGMLDKCFIENSDDRLDLNGIFETVDKVYLEKEVETLKKTVEDKDQMLSEAFADKESFKTKVMEVLEHELLCGVCSEMLYQAVTLNCKHTFCSLCITEWKKKKKECPVCRAAIKVEVSPLLIDSFIDKAVEMLGGDYKTRREELKTERTAQAVPAKKPVQRKKGRRTTRNTRSRVNNVITLSSNLSPSVILEHIEIPDNRRIDVGEIIDLTSPVRGPRVNCLP